MPKWRVDNSMLTKKVERLEQLGWVVQKSLIECESQAMLKIGDSLAIYDGNDLTIEDSEVEYEYLDATELADMTADDIDGFAREAMTR